MKKFLGLGALLLVFIIFVLFWFYQKDINNRSVWLIHTDFKDLKEDTGVWKNTNTLVNKEGDRVSLVFKEQAYSIRFDSLFPLDLVRKNIKVKATAKVKLLGRKCYPNMVVNLFRGDSVVYRVEKDIVCEEDKEWFESTQEFLIPRNFIQSDTRFRYYILNSSKDTLMISDLNISVEELPLKSYLPKVRFSNDKRQETTVFENSFIKIKQTDSGSLRIYDAENNLIINGLMYYFEYNDWTQLADRKAGEVLKKDLTKHIRKVLRERYKVESFKVLKSTDKSLTLVAENPKADLQIHLTMSENGSKIDWHTSTHYKTDVAVFREALVFLTQDDISALYLKNGDKDTAYLEEEYWLSRQGLKVGEKALSTYFLPTSDISSYQAKTFENQVFVNLDYALDHPLIHFPLRETDENYFVNISDYTFEKGDTVAHQFTMQTGIDNDFYPRKMRTRNGFLSHYIFSEHADYTDLRLHKAVYFGRSDIDKAEDAVGGFVKYNIPVTKSVFYNNLDSIMNDDKRYKTHFNSLIASIQNTEGMFDFLKEIEACGSEIVLHTPEQFVTNKKNLKEALDFTQQHFNSKNWIDHGYDNSSKRNREDVVCDAFNKESEFYALPLYKSKGLKYFWSCYYEDVVPYNGLAFYPYIKRPYAGFGQRFPMPEYWEHKTQAPNVYFWKTAGSLDLGHWDTYFSETVLEDFINHYSFEINHSYPARINPKTHFWQYAEGDLIKIDEGFDRFLKRLSEHQKKKEIECTTVSDILDFWTQSDSLDFCILKKNVFKVKNTSMRPLKGLTYMCEADSVEMNVPFENKKHQSHLIFNFDLNSGQEAVIKLY